MESAIKGQIRNGSIVHVVEKRGRRVRINNPITGWLSEYNGEGELILQRYDVKSVLVDNAILEKEKRREARSNPDPETIEYIRNQIALQSEK